MRTAFDIPNSVAECAEFWIWNEKCVPIFGERALLLIAIRSGEQGVRVSVFVPKCGQ